MAAGTHPAPPLRGASQSVSQWLDAVDGWRWRSIVEVTDVEVCACGAFSYGVEPTNAAAYVARAQLDADHRRQQGFVGKLGEWATWRMLRERWASLDAPDMTILPPGQKSYASDLLPIACAGDAARTPSVHVKTQELTRANWHGTSWVFTHGDPAVWRTRVPAPPATELVAFCVALDAELRRFMVVALVPLDVLRAERLFWQARLPTQQVDKVAVYLDGMLASRAAVASCQAVDAGAAAPTARDLVAQKRKLVASPL